MPLRTLIGTLCIALATLLGACSGEDAPPAAGGGGRDGGSIFGAADSFTQSVAQAASSNDGQQEPSGQLAQMTAPTPENTEPANL